MSEGNRHMTEQERSNFTPAATRAEALARLRRFLATDPEGRYLRDTSVMWTTAGVSLLWGDLRRLAEDEPEPHQLDRRRHVPSLPPDGPDPRQSEFGK